MAIKSLIGKLFGADAVPPRDAMKLDGTTAATLARCLSALPPDERGWLTFAAARIFFGTECAAYAFADSDRDGRRTIEPFAPRPRSVKIFTPVERRGYFVRD